MCCRILSFYRKVIKVVHKDAEHATNRWRSGQWARRLGNCAVRTCRWRHRRTDRHRAVWLATVWARWCSCRQTGGSWTRLWYRSDAVRWRRVVRRGRRRDYTLCWSCDDLSHQLPASTTTTPQRQQYPTKCPPPRKTKPCDNTNPC